MRSIGGAGRAARHARPDLLHSDSLTSKCQADFLHTAYRPAGTWLWSCFRKLDNVATWVYESGWFIGNDSGIGHLASSLHIPTLSLFMRRGIARTWRPDWGTGQVLIGSTFLPTGFLKERYWKYMLSVRQVSRAFEQLRASLSFA